MSFTILGQVSTNIAKKITKQNHYKLPKFYKPCFERCLHFLIDDKGWKVHSFPHSCVKSKQTK